MGVARSIAGVQPFAELFQGATTTVFKGYEPAQDRFVLLKVLRMEFSADEVVARRFEEEARMAARIEHPNVVKVYSFGSDEEGTYIIAEFVEGMNLRALIETGKLPPELAAYILLQVAYGLQAAHDQGILHRDIKPENILISYEGQVKLADFGMASFTESLEDAAEIRGTLGYLSPEQVLGEPLGPSSDLFSLGATFYEMLTGRAAFVGAQLAQIFDAIVHYDPVPYLEADRAAPGVLVQICRKLLAKNPSERYADTAKLITDLQASLEPLGEAASQAALHTFLESPTEYVSPGPELFEPVPGLSGDGHAQAPAEAVVRTGQVSPKHTGNRKPVAKRRRFLAGIAAVVVLLAVVAGVWLVMSDAGWRVTFMREEVASSDSMLSAPDSLLLAAELERQILIDSVAQAEEAARIQAQNRQPQSRRNANLEGDLRNPGKLLVDCSPWCWVYVDDVYVGETPMIEPVSIQAGKRQITLRHTLYPPVIISAEVKPGETEQLKIILNEHVGHVTIRFNPPSATIFIDGTERDPASLQEPIRLSPGTHRLAIVDEELGTYETDIEVKAGETLQLEYNLEELLE